MQWNARNVVADGQEFKQFLNDLKGKPEIISITETWFKPRLDFVIPGYNCERKDREATSGGGCATFIRNGIQYRRLEVSAILVCIIIEVWGDRGKITPVNVYIIPASD